MIVMTVTDVRKHFGALLDAVQHEPVLILRSNRAVAVIMSAEEYRRICGITSFKVNRAKLTKRTTGSRKSR